ncbi:MAG TPA: hypothetical protein VGF67_19880 [Ktedonobacteraceae bacterium]
MQNKSTCPTLNKFSTAGKRTTLIALTVGTRWFALAKGARSAGITRKMPGGTA